MEQQQQQQYLQDDWQLGMLPLPALTGYIPLAEPLTAKCHSFLNRANVDRLDQDLEQLAKQIMINNEQLRKFLESAEEETTKVEQPVIPAAVKPAIMQTTWTTIKSGFNRLLNKQQPPPPPKQEEPTTTPPTNTETIEEEEDDSLLTVEETNELEGKLSEQHDMLVQALSVLTRWLQLVDSLSNKRVQILSTRIWRSVWKSAFGTQDEFETSCLRVHSIMLTHLVASMTYNFARRCEIFQACRPESKGYSDQYQMAFRLWDQFARREILIVNAHGLQDDRVPPEASIDSCAFFMRLCLIRIQRAAIVHYVRLKNLVFDSHSTMVTSETPDELAIDQVEISRMIQDQILYGNNRAQKTSTVARRYRLGFSADTKQEQMQLVIRMALHLFALVHAPSTNERLLFLSPERKFAVSPTFSVRHVVQAASLLDDLQHLDLFARCTIFFFGALCCPHQEEKRLQYAQSLYRILQPEILQLYVRNDQFYGKLWRDGLLKKLLHSIVDGEALVKSQQPPSSKGLLEQIVSDFGPPLFCIVAKDWESRIFKPIAPNSQQKILTMDKMFVE